jgi:hypothetical protein
MRAEAAVDRSACIGQKQLARRWGLSHRTLERWRCKGQGPNYLKLGGRVSYRLADIERFEAQNFHVAGRPFGRPEEF